MVNKVKVKIRGIYSTALTCFLKEKGFNIIQPSEIMTQRMDLEESDESADILIYDKEDLNGVTVNGIESEKIITTLYRT